MVNRISQKNSNDIGNLRYVVSLPEAFVLVGDIVARLKTYDHTLLLSHEEILRMGRLVCESMDKEEDPESGFFKRSIT